MVFLVGNINIFAREGSLARGLSLTARQKLEYLPVDPENDTRFVGSWHQRVAHVFTALPYTSEDEFQIRS